MFKILIYFLIYFNLFIIFRPSLSFAQSTISISINSNNIKNNFTNNMRGMAFVNWDHSWGRKFPGEVPGLALAMKETKVGLIRYAGGLWANSVGWDRVPQRTPYTTWVKNGNTYYFHYGTNEIDSVAKLSRDSGADVMIQVNVATNDPAMWADMVKYTNVEKGYGFKYWELANELDVASDLGVTPDIYAQRIKAYIDQMKAVDPTIIVVGGVPGSAHDAPAQGWSDAITEMSQYLSKTAQVVTPGGKRIDSLSWHWYQACNSTSFQDLLRWNWTGTPTTSWRNGYSRIWSQIAPSRIQNEIINPNIPTATQGITELNFDACDYENVTNGNHINAIWMADILGRLSYNGLDYQTWYEGYASQGLSMLYPDNIDNTTKILTRPSFYTYILYAKYFGNQLIESSTNEAVSEFTKLSAWASKDTNDPGKLKVIVTNLSSGAITSPINITGFTPTKANIYVMSSTSPTGTNNTDNAPTRINGVKINAMNVAGSVASIQPVVQTISGLPFSYSFPAYSSTAIVFEVLTTPTSSPTLPPTSTPTQTQPSLTPTSTTIPTNTPAPKKLGDVDGNGIVDIFDFNEVVGLFGTVQSNPFLDADLDKSGEVDLFDFNEVVANFSP